MNQGSRLECLPRFFVGQLLRGQPAQLLVDQRQELARGVRVESLDDVPHRGNLAHGAHEGSGLFSARPRAGRLQFR